MWKGRSNLVVMSLELDFQDSGHGLLILRARSQRSQRTVQKTAELWLTDHL